MSDKDYQVIIDEIIAQAEKRTRKARNFSKPIIAARKVIEEAKELSYQNDFDCKGYKGWERIKGLVDNTNYPYRAILPMTHPRAHCVAPLKWDRPDGKPWEVKTTVRFDNAIELILFHLFPRIVSGNIPLDDIARLLGEQGIAVQPNRESINKLQEDYHDQNYNWQ